jgi:hypothetical protein
MLTLLDLDALDPLVELQGSGLTRLPVLFCWTCPAAQSIVRYQLLTPGNVVRLINYEQEEPVTDFPYEDYPVSFPRHALRFQALTEHERSYLHELNTTDNPGPPTRAHRDLARPQHQIGGEPYLVQPLQRVPCPECRRIMPFFGTIGDDTLSPRKFTGNDFVQTLVHLCRACRVAAVYQQCDWWAQRRSLFRAA